MANPLKKTPEPFRASNDDELLERCHRENFAHAWVRGNRWHYVEPATADHPARIAILDSIAAEEVWIVLNGGRLTYEKWPLGKLAALERTCRTMIARGMLPDGGTQV